MIIRLSLKNVFRNKRRTLITVLIVAIGISMLILAMAYVEYIKWGLRESTIHGITGHLQVMNKDFNLRQEERILQYGIDGWEKLEVEIKKNPMVEVTVPRINFSGLASTGDKSNGIMVVAVIPEREINLGGEFIDAQPFQKLKERPDGIILATGLAKLLNAKPHESVSRPGDLVTLMTTTAEGALNAMDFEVVGTITMSVEELSARYAIISLDSAHNLLNTRRIERLAIGLKKTEDLPAAIPQIKALLPSGLVEKTWQEVDTYFEKVMNFFYQFIGFLLPILMIIVWFSTMNTVMMSILERSSELATLRAMGTSKWRLFKMLFTEGQWIGIIGVTLGFVIEMVLAALINHSHIMIIPPGYNEGYLLRVRNIPEIFVFFGLLMLLVVGLSTIIPAMRIFKVNIVKALRRQ